MTKKSSLGIIALLLCMMIPGCGNRAGVSTDGSTSMSKVIGALSEAYEAETGVAVSYNGTGSGSGIQAVLEGRCDIGLSSRNLKEKEVADGLTATVLAYDGIVLIVNPNNAINGLSRETVAEIYTGQITNWKELGWQDAPIVLIGREAGSGTRDGFEAITDTQGRCPYRQELTSTGDVITTVATNPNAIGYASLASVKETVKVLSVDGVVPCEETVKSGNYAIRRPFVLVTKEGAELSNEAQDFLAYVTSEKAREIILSVGVVPANG